MSFTKSADQEKQSRQLAILFATNSSHSIIGEIVDGKTNAIAYSAYGEQSAQQHITTRLGFNGQLRETNIGWSLLGNGYRVYNPRLMRFHSPDSWSPFGGGGLNAFMYCAGDPINRFDPTGHSWFSTMLQRFRNVFKSKNSNIPPSPPPGKGAANGINITQDRRGSPDYPGVTSYVGTTSPSTSSSPSLSTTPSMASTSKRFALKPSGSINTPWSRTVENWKSLLPDSPTSSRRSSSSSVSSSSSSAPSWSPLSSDSPQSSSQAHIFGAFTDMRDGKTVQKWIRR